MQTSQGEAPIKSTWDGICPDTDYLRHAGGKSVLWLCEWDEREPSGTQTMALICPFVSGVLLVPSEPPVMTDLVNSMGFRISMETNLWVYICEEGPRNSEADTEDLP